MKHLLALVLLLPALALGQATSDVVLTLDFENVVGYVLDPAESPLWMSSAAKVPEVPSSYILTLKNYFQLADLVAVNGKPAKGTGVWWGFWTRFLAPATPTAKRPIADIVRNTIGEGMIEVHDPEKGQVGTLAVLFLGGAGAAPPGTPPGTTLGNSAITGGTGIWSGVRGQAGSVSSSDIRTITAVEDPAYRRVNGGGKWRIAVTLNSVALPTVVAAYHGDFSPVSASSPAHPGETLVLAVKGLGPTTPTLVPGKTFDSEKLAAVTSPVTAMMNDLPAPVSNAVGWPGTNDTYRVDVTVPGVAPGTAGAALTVAWMQGPEFKIPVK